jgi:hypothetical protein
VFGVLFGFIVPFDDPFASYRTFTQQASMRAIISFSRMLLEFFSIILVVYWLTNKLVTLKAIINYFAIVVISSVIIGFAIYYFPLIFRPIFPNFAHHFIGTRFTGLVGEPRTFGRFCSFALIFLLYYFRFGKKNTMNLAIILSSLGVVISLSASAYIVTMVGMSMLFLLRRNFASFAIVIVFSLVGFVFLSEDEFFKNTTMEKINSVISIEHDEKIEKRINEPGLFTRFEIFDRAALNFLYNNPEYFLFGVGPNLVSIPASQYLPPEFVNSEVYGNGINSVPTTFFVNILARSGFFGLFLQLLFFVFIYKRLKNKSSRYCYLTTFIMSLITATNVFLIIAGVSISVIFMTKKNKSFKVNYEKSTVE